MKVVFATFVELVIWALCFALLPFLLKSWWDIDPSAPFGAGVLAWGASMVGFILARTAGDAIVPGDNRAHAFTLLIAVIVLLGDVIISPFGSIVTWTRIGGIIAAIVDWRTSGASLRAASA